MSVTSCYLTCSVKSASVSGTVYRPGGVVITSSTLMPVFAVIVDILIVDENQSCVFICNQFTTQCFNHHFHSYELTPSAETIAIKQNDLFDFYVLTAYKVQAHSHNLFVPLKYHIMEEIDM